MAELVRRRRRHRPEAGTVPGTMKVDPDAPKPVMRLMAYGPDECIERPVNQLAALREAMDKYPVLWLNVDGLGDAQVLQKIGEMFNLHPLALADTVHVTQRPKVENYDAHAFFVVRMPHPEEAGETEQVSLYLGDGFVITFQERPGDCLDPVRERIRKSIGRIRRMGPDYLAYALIDAVIDGYFPTLENYGERMEHLETRIIHKPDEAMIRQIHETKRALLHLRRGTWPLREALSSVLRGEVPRVASETQLYMRDCYDHVTQIIDMLETYRELASGLLDAYLSSLSNRMNEVMKVLTVIATIFIPLSFIAGVYGMNFSHDVSRYNMPELYWKYGYPFALLLMLGVAGGMLYYFRKKGWLGNGNGNDAGPRR